MAFVSVKVPVPVTGEPETVNSAGAESPTLVTVPPAFASAAQVSVLPTAVTTWPAAHALGKLARRAQGTLPAVIAPVLSIVNFATPP